MNFNVDKIRGRGLDWFLNKKHLMYLGGFAILSLGLQQLSIILGWQGVPDTLANRMQIVALALCFGTIGFALGKVGLNETLSGE